MVLWLAVLVLAIILGTWAITAFVLIVFFFFLGILVYASMIFHKDRKEDQRGDYEKTVANEKMPAVGHFAQNPSSLSVMSGAIQQRYDTMPGNRDSSASYTSYH